MPHNIAITSVSKKDQDLCHAVHTETGCKDFYDEKTRKKGERERDLAIQLGIELVLQ